MTLLCSRKVTQHHRKQVLIASGQEAVLPVGKSSSQQQCVCLGELIAFRVVRGSHPGNGTPLGRLRRMMEKAKLHALGVDIVAHSCPPWARPCSKLLQLNANRSFAAHHLWLFPSTVRVILRLIWNSARNAGYWGFSRSASAW